MFGSWLYCSKNCHCSTCARSYGSLGNELRPVAEVPQDRVRLRERPAVVEDERRDAKPRVQLAEHLGAIRAVDDRQLDGLVLDPELRQQQAHLVTVARGRRVVEKHLDSVVGRNYAQAVATAPDKTAERRGARQPPRARSKGRQRRAEAHGSGRRPSRRDLRARPRSPGSPDPAGLLLRYSGSRPQRRRRRRAGAADPGTGGRHGRQAPPGGPGRSSGGAAPLAERRSRGRCDARRLRVLRVAEGEGGCAVGPRRRAREARDQEALLEGAARVLRRSCARGSCLSTISRSSGRSSS